MRTKLVLTGRFGAKTIVISIAAGLLISCGGDTQPAPAKQAEAPKPAEKPSDESRRFPTANLVRTEVVDRQLMGKAFMPGGTIAHYKRGKIQYDLFAARLADANAAAFVLPDWRKALSDGNTAAQLVPSFGGYFGSDAGRSVFVFSRGVWIAGVAGLPLKDADAEARTLAARLN